MAIFGGSIAFNDGAAASLVPITGRLDGWIPSPGASLFGDRQDPLDRATAPVVFEIGINASASFSVLFTNDNMPIAVRLKKHLERGGVCTVNTGDNTNRSYANCCLYADGDIPAITQENKDVLDYRITLTLRNLASTDMVCIYQ